MSDQKRKSFRDHLHAYRLEIRHVTVLFIVLIIFQTIVSLLDTSALQKSLRGTQEWYQRDAAERLANLTTTSLELVLESRTQATMSEADVRKIIQSVNILMNQPLLNENVKTLCILIPRDTGVAVIDDGHVLYSFLYEGRSVGPPATGAQAAAVNMFRQIRDSIALHEQIYTLRDAGQEFHVFVPLVLRGELAGVLYMCNKPDFSNITDDITLGFQETSMAFSGLIIFGLLAMFYISSYTLRERNQAQALLFEKEKEHLAAQIEHRKELLFTKRIYHTHHKAEKIMGFIKEDLRSMTAESIDTIQYRVGKYANFIARVIYDMKWYDPPVQTVRGALFRTDMNEVIRFIVDNIFLRLSRDSGASRFALSLDDALPHIPVNEFVIWEVLEPIIQNCLEHGEHAARIITIKTLYDEPGRKATVTIADNGPGIAPELLEVNERGIKRVFLEHVSTKTQGGEHSGYGCYIAHEIATQRCGWHVDAENLPGGGCRFTFTIPV